eukprot:snap_masked-scaffold_44-processed-gene-1.77-mRNA-1 protein AED:1.00 eAED:1.00 QI:0/0/0/0/1/1/2/0/71
MGLIQGRERGSREVYRQGFDWFLGQDVDSGYLGVWLFWVGMELGRLGGPFRLYLKGEGGCVPFIGWGCNIF